MISIFLGFQGIWNAQIPTFEILQQLLNNPFGKLKEMEVNDVEIPIFELKTAEKLFLRKKESLIIFEWRGNQPLYAKIQKIEGHNGVSFGIESNEKPDHADFLKLESFFLILESLIPNFDYGFVSSAFNIGDFHNQSNLRYLPNCFGSVLYPWYVIRPHSYKLSFERESLLRAPFYKILERQDGTLEITTYEDPLSYESRETQQKIIEITEYLNECRFDK